MALRNFQKLVHSSAFAAKTHPFIFSSAGRKFSPASYYFNPNENLQNGTSHDPFTLSMISYELTRENQCLQQTLQKFNDSAEKKNLIDEIKNKIDENNAFIADHLKQLAVQFKTNAFDVPVDACSNAVFAFENNGNSQKDLYEKFIFPIIKKKLDYMSFHGLANLINGIVSSKSTQDQALVKSVLERLKQKVQEANQAEFVEYSAWKVDRYEKSEKKQAAQADFVQYASEGNNSFVGNLKNWLRVTYSTVQNFLLFRIFYRETRINRQFGEVNEEDIRKTLLEDLEKLHSLDSNLNCSEIIDLLRKA